jgi:Fe-Mn family superoxide dismutase
MNKREFLKTASILSAGVVLSPLAGCATRGLASTAPLDVNGEFTLPALGFALNALEPHIDAMTMEIHHGKHHAAYVTNLNKAIAGAPAFQNLTIEQVCEKVTAEDTAIRNNGGGHYNHSKFWNWITPGGATAPSTEVAAAIDSAFGNFEEFKKQFSDAAKTRFGSGWAWLCVGTDKKLYIASSPNQDNPLMKNLMPKTGTPILGLDVWEHAYYLHYQNRRPDYVSAFFNVINWTKVAEDFAAAMK